MAHQPFASAPYVVGGGEPAPSLPHIPAEEALCPVVSHDWVNAEYKHLVVEASPKALAVKPGPVLQPALPVARRRRALAAPAAERLPHRPRARPHRVSLQVRRPRHARAGDAQARRRSQHGRPARRRLQLDPAWKNIVVLGRGVGLATMAPISQLAGENGVGVTAILSARSPDFVMAADLFGKVGDVINVLDTDGTSAVENVEAILQRLIAEKKADAFYTCGSNRLLQLMKRLGKAARHSRPGRDGADHGLRARALLRLRAHVRGRTARRSCAASASKARCSICRRRSDGRPVGARSGA